MTKLTTLKFDLLKTKYFNKFCLCKEIERLHSNKIPSMARCGYLLGWSKVSFAFSITSYRKTWISFLANPIYLEAKKKKKKKKSGLYEAVRARSMKNTWISFKAHASLGSTAGPWRSRTWLRRKALESDQCGLESQLRVIPENENDPNKWCNLSEPQFCLLYNVR